MASAESTAKPTPTPRQTGASKPSQPAEVAATNKAGEMSKSSGAQSQKTPAVQFTPSTATGTAGSRPAGASNPVSSDVKTSTTVTAGQTPPGANTTSKQQAGTTATAGSRITEPQSRAVNATSTGGEVSKTAGAQSQKTPDVQFTPSTANPVSSNVKTSTTVTAGQTLPGASTTSKQQAGTTATAGATSTGGEANKTATTQSQNAAAVQSTNTVSKQSQPAATANAASTTAAPSLSSDDHRSVSVIN